MADINAIANEISRQASAIFSNLPPGEVLEDDPLVFTISKGRVVIFLPRGDSYWFEVDRVFRLRLTPDGAEITAFRNGAEVDLSAKN